jgi:hypothetical protein
VVAGTCLEHTLNPATMCHVCEGWRGEIMTRRTMRVVSNLALLINFVRGGNKRAVGEEDGTWRCGELWRSHGASSYFLCCRS